METLYCENLLGIEQHHVKLSDKKMTSGWNTEERAIYQYKWRKREGLKQTEYDIPEYLKKM